MRNGSNNLRKMSLCELTYCKTIRNMTVHAITGPMKAMSGTV